MCNYYSQTQWLRDMSVQTGQKFNENVNRFGGAKNQQQHRQTISGTVIRESQYELE